LAWRWWLGHWFCFCDIGHDYTVDMRQLGGYAMPNERTRFVLNRALIVLAVALILGGLFFNQWRIVLRNALLICYACLGLG